MALDLPTDAISSFVHLVFIGFIAMFPVFNPIGTAFVVNPFFDGISQRDRVRYVRKVTFMVFYFSVIVIFLGHLILELFGISVSVVRVAGGIVIFMIGWNILSGKSESKNNHTGQEQEQEMVAGNNKKEIESKLLYPITFPMTAGAGAISVLMTLSSHTSHKDISGYILNTSAVIVALILICALVYIMYSNTNKIIEKLGEKNKVVINKIFAFLIMCVGIDIISDGLITLFNITV